MRDMGINEVLNYLPHRYPFVLIDRVLECTPGEFIVAVKNVTYNEPFFPGHFPVRPVMPAVLILETMAQATGILVQKTLGGPTDENSVYYFVGIDKARFRQPVEPGDQLIVEARLTRSSRGIWRVDAHAKVDGKVVADAELMGALREAET